MKCPKTDVQAIANWLKALSRQELAELRSEFYLEGEIDEIAQGLASEGFAVNRYGTLAKIVRF